MTPPLRALLLTGLLLLDVSGAHAVVGAAETRIVQLKHRSADELLPVLLPLLERDGRIKPSDGVGRRRPYKKTGRGRESLQGQVATLDQLARLGRERPVHS